MLSFLQKIFFTKKVQTELQTSGPFGNRKKNKKQKNKKITFLIKLINIKS